MTVSKRRGRPPKADEPTVVVSAKVPRSLKRDAAAIAAARGDTLTDIVEAALDRYVARHRRLLDPPCGDSLNP